jgi:hypothetical protein
MRKLLLGTVLILTCIIGCQDKYESPTIPPPTLDPVPTVWVRHYLIFSNVYEVTITDSTDVMIELMAGKVRDDLVIRAMRDMRGEVVIEEGDM